MTEESINEKEVTNNNVQLGTKLLVAGTANSGKTTLIKNLRNAVVFSCDGKPFPFKMFHADFPDIENDVDFIEKTDRLLKAYKKQTGKRPETVVFDSISTIVGTIYSSLQQSASGKNGFDVWNKYLACVQSINKYINDLNSRYGLNIVLITHAQYNVDIEKWEDTTKGSFAKKDGGFISTVDYSVFIDVVKGNKRNIYLDDAFRLARTKLDLTNEEKKVDANDFNLQEYLDRIANYKEGVESFKLL